MSDTSHLHLLSVPAIMLVICLLNLFWNHRRNDGRLALDGIRLQSALVEELRFLIRLYTSNLEALEKADVRLISTRTSMTIYRGNVARLTLLQRDFIERLVFVHTNNEHIDFLLAQQSKSIKAGTAPIYVFDNAQEAKNEFQPLFEGGIRYIQDAIQTLEHGRKIAPRSETSFASDRGQAALQRSGNLQTELT